MAIDVSAVSYESGRQALQLATDGGGSIQDIALLLEEEAGDHLNSSSLDPGDGYWVDSCDHHTALEIAASAGDIDAVERLLEAGADPNAPVHEMGTSALEAAAAQGRLAVVQMLLEIGAHPDYRHAERLGGSPLIAAAKAGHVEICEALLKHGADVSILAQLRSLTFYSAVEAAGETSNTTLLELFLGEIEVVANRFDPDDLDAAIAEGQQEDSRRLLRTKEFLDRAQKSIDYALSTAAESGNILIIQRLLDAGAVITGSEDDGTNAIADAASGGQLEAMNKLLHAASVRNNLPEWAVTAALQSAVDEGDIALVEPLLQSGADATRIDILKAATEAHFDVLTYILQSGGLVEPTGYGIWGFTALQLAAQHGHHAVVELLLAKGADVNARVRYIPMTGATALQLAVAGEHLAITRRLIDAGAEVNRPYSLVNEYYDECNEADRPVSPPNLDKHEADTPLQAAARTGNMIILELLLAAGAVVDGGVDWRLDQFHRGRHKSVLSIAAEAGHRDVVARLLSIMPLDDARQAAPRALHEAAVNQHTDIVRQLLQQLQLHPDVNMRREGVHDPTLLQSAAANGDFEMLEMLLLEGADVNLNPSKGQQPTALQSASERGDLAAVSLLLAAGAEVNVTGSTAPPLLLAIRGCHVQVFEHLLAAGADIHAVAYHGQTILEAAEDSGDNDIQDWVRAALESRPPPEIDQPLDWATGLLCETCRMAPLADLFRGNLSDVPELVLHPSLTALRTSAATGCPFCWFLWKRLGIASISLPQPSPVQLKAHPGNIMVCDIREPFPPDYKVPESLNIKFPFFTGPLAEKFRVERVPITEDTSSPETYQQIHNWLDTCKNEHSKCREPSGNASLPTRLIYLDTSEDSSSSLQPRLVYTNDMEYSECKYIALSYRWPEDFPVEAKSSRDNVREQMRGLNTSKLPQIFNDAFQVAVRLGISYFWIDSLCIVQDDPEDWNREAALMIQIYRYAEFTVAVAVRPTNPDLGLFRHGDPSDVPFVTLPGVRDPREDGSGQDVVLMKPQKESYRESPLVSRGWCFQEREISRRIVHYTETQVLWECRTFRASEGRPDGVREGYEDWKKRMLDDDSVGNSIDEAWFRAVEDYSARDLTVYTDKFPALSGLAATVRDYKPANCRYLAGLWEDNFLTCLLWSSPTRDGNPATNTRYPEHVAPTWSWASVDGPISYQALSFAHSLTEYSKNTESDTQWHFMLKVLDICVQTSANNSFGFVRHAVLTCTAAVVAGLLKHGSDGLGLKLARPDGVEIATMYFDVDQEKYDGEELLEVVFCILVIQLTWCENGIHGRHGLGMVVLPTGNRENEYRRIGMMEIREWVDCFDDAEVKEITII